MNRPLTTKQLYAQLAREFRIHAQAQAPRTYMDFSTVIDGTKFRIQCINEPAEVERRVSRWLKDAKKVFTTKAYKECKRASNFKVGAKISRSWSHTALDKYKVATTLTTDLHGDPIIHYDMRDQ